MRALAFCLMLVGPFLSGVPASADDAKARAIWKHLNEDIDPAIVPKGVTFDFVEPIARGDEDIRQDVEGRVAARFKRPGLIVTRTVFGDDGWEGFAYFVFADSERAKKFAITEPEAAELLQYWLGGDEAKEKFNPKAWRAPVPVSIDGGNRQLRCIAADFLIGCLTVPPNSPVAIYLALQEPRLRAATSDEERMRVVVSRVRQEADGLLKTAEAHLAKAQQAAAAR